MSAGKYRNKVTIQRVTRTVNDYGETVESWTDLHTTWAALLPVSVKEIINNGQQVEIGEVKIHLRWCSEIQDLSTDDRVKQGERIYNLSTLVDVGNRQREFHCLAKEAR